MTTRDRRGRRYVAILPFDDGPVKAALAAVANPAHRCVVCGVVIIHGTDRYYQRTASLFAVSQMERALRLIDYDPVCASCGDRALLAIAAAG